MSDNPLPLARLTVTVRFLLPGFVSGRWAQTLRGGLGYILRALFCCYAFADCRLCPQKTRCPYGYLFESPPPPRTEVMRLYPYVPHPMVVEEPPLRAPEVKKGEELDFSLVLMGRALGYVPFLTRALEGLGRAGLGRDKVPFELLSLFDQGLGRLYPPGRFPAEPEPLNLSFEPGPSRRGRLILSFLTPSRLLVNGRLALAPGPVDLVASLARRLFLLRYFHGDGVSARLSPLFFEAAREAFGVSSNLTFRDFERYSTRKKAVAPLGGLTGTLGFEGDAGLLAPLFRLGEYVHLGKNTIFGLGRIAFGES